MNNEKLLQELQELNLLWTGLSHIPNLPKELLELSLNKLENINVLLKNVKDASATLIIPSSSAEFVTSKETSKGSLTGDTISIALISDNTRSVAQEMSITENEAVVIAPGQEKERSPAITPPKTKRSIPDIIQESLPEESKLINQTSQKPASKLLKQQSAKPESLMDRYEKNHSKESLQRKLENKHFADLSKALSLNDRFRFRRDLFGNSADKMNQALQELNELKSMGQALDYMHRHYSMFEESESFIDFCILLENHFSR